MSTGISCPSQKLRTPYRTETYAWLSRRRMSVQWMDVQAIRPFSPVLVTPVPGKNTVLVCVHYSIDVSCKLTVSPEHGFILIKIAAQGLPLIEAGWSFRHGQDSLLIQDVGCRDYRAPSRHRSQTRSGLLCTVLLAIRAQA